MSNIKDERTTIPQEEVQQLQMENKELKAQLQTLLTKLQTLSAGDHKSSTKNMSSATSSSTSDKAPVAALPEDVINSTSKRHVIVASQKCVDGLNQQVYVAELNSQEWWQLLGKDGEDETAKDSQSSGDDTKFASSELDDDENFVLIDDEDATEAIQRFVLQSVQNYPQVEKLSPEELRRLISGTFDKLKEPTKFQKAYDWAKFLYSTYGWTACAYKYVVAQPALVTFVASGIVRGVSYLVFLVV
jgi:hypothetical protein